MSKLKELINHLLWMFILQGIAFVVLAILILWYPEVLFVLVAATFLFIGLTLFVFAHRVYTLRRLLDKGKNILL